MFTTHRIGRSVFPSLLAIVLGMHSAVLAGVDVNLTRLIIPHVVRGDAGVFFETRIVISNPGLETAEVTISSDDLDLEGEETAFQLGPQQSREILLSGGPLQVGALLITSDRPVSGTALLSSRPAPDSSEVLGEASVFAAEPAARVLVPVFVRSPAAENTGIAIHYLHRGDIELRFTLFDMEGVEVASRTERAPFVPGVQFPGDTSRAAFFVTDIFPDLPESFRQGVLIVEQAFPPQIAESFALIGLYTRGLRFWAAQAIAVDDVRSYTVTPKSAENLQETADQLSALYGFEVRLIVNNFLSIRATKEVARAVSRDARVEKVSLTQPLNLSSAP